MNSRTLASFSTVAALGLLITVGGDQSTLLAAETDASKTATARSYLVEQNGDAFCVNALRTGETVEKFYGYERPHSHTSTDIEKSQVSSLFLFHGPNGTSLVTLHDEPNEPGKGHGDDTGGGAASFDFNGLPGKPGAWVVQDDSGDFNGKTDASPDWAWATRHTDGGVWRGGLDGDFKITIDPAFNDAAQRNPLNPGKIKEWHLLSGDANNPERTRLDMKKKVTISTGCANVDIDIKPGGEPNAINLDSAGKDKGKGKGKSKGKGKGKGTIPVAILHTDDFDPGTVDVSTVRFGDPEDVEAGKGAAPSHNGHSEDVDKDGDKDLVLHFPTGDAGFEGDEKTGSLVGETKDGDRVFGKDSVKIVGS